MIRPIRFGLGLAACLTLLASCGNRDPYKRDDVWYPTGSNAANLAAQVADPNDLVRGRSDPSQSSAAPIRAVNRVWNGATAGNGAAGNGNGATGGSGAGESPAAPTIPTPPGG